MVGVLKNMYYTVLYSWHYILKEKRTNHINKNLKALNTFK